METIGGRYEMVSLLGAGGMGEVFLARDNLLRRRVAVKRIKGDPLEESTVAAERLMREAHSAALIQHPNVVAIHDLVVENGHTYIIMEFVDAKTLAQIIRDEGNLSPVRVAHIGAQMSDALAAAHLLEVVHRDVKPANIMVDPGGRARLADFGVARSSGDPGLTSTGHMIGSVAFMAPEVAEGKTATSAADVYSLGATLFAALEGHAPHALPGEANTSVQVLLRLVTRPAPPCAAGTRLGAIIDSMLAMEPGLRPKSSDLHDQIVAAVADRAPALASEAVIEEPASPGPGTSLPGHDGSILAATQVPSTAEELAATIVRGLAGPPAPEFPRQSPVQTAAGTLDCVDRDSRKAGSPSIRPHDVPAKSLVPSATARANSPGRVHRRMWLIGVCAAALVVPATGFAFFRSGPSPSTSQSLAVTTTVAPSIVSTPSPSPAPKKFDYRTYTGKGSSPCEGKVKSFTAVAAEQQLSITISLSSRLGEIGFIPIYLDGKGKDEFPWVIQVGPNHHVFYGYGMEEWKLLENRVDGTTIKFQFPLSKMKPTAPVAILVLDEDGAPTCSDVVMVD